ncbi:hypothetical protein CRG98_033277, partial [Punica granatum]
MMIGRKICRKAQLIAAAQRWLCPQASPVPVPASPAPLRCYSQLSCSPSAMAPSSFPAARVR